MIHIIKLESIYVLKSSPTYLFLFINLPLKNLSDTSTQLVPASLLKILSYKTTYISLGSMKQYIRLAS